LFAHETIVLFLKFLKPKEILKFHKVEGTKNSLSKFQELPS